MDSQVEQKARELCDSFEARLIADQIEAPAFDESAPHVQDYWRALASLALPKVESETWQPIESAPKDRAVLLFNDDTREQAVCTHMTSMEDGDQAWIMARGLNELGLQIAFRFLEPTHWRPLPTPPSTLNTGGTHD